MISSQHLPTPAWIVKEDLHLEALVAYPIFSAFNNHDVEGYIHTAVEGMFLVWLIPGSHSGQITDLFGLSHGLVF